MCARVCVCWGRGGKGAVGRKRRITGIKKSGSVIFDWYSLE